MLAELQEANQQLHPTPGRWNNCRASRNATAWRVNCTNSVSQTMFSISLQCPATHILLEREPDRLRPQLEQLQALTQNALVEMRSLIAHLRPPEGESADVLRLKTHIPPT